MRRINLPLITDVIFTLFCTFLITFTAARFYLKSAFWGLFLAIPVSLLAALLAFVYISRKQQKKFNLSSADREKRLLAAHLSLISQDNLNALFLKLFKNDIIAKNGELIYGGKKVVILFSFKPVSIDDAAKTIKEHGKNICVYCNALDEEAAPLFKQLGVEYTQINGVYDLLKNANLLPEKYLYDDKKRLNIFNRISSRFNKKLCLPLFWSGLGLTLFSYFTFFPVYYVISGGILLTLSCTALIFGKKQN
ncbi:MAG: hypothetical protein J6B04_03745 [Clostridia bacterium]|nr:hypothetical protein [Clostridia bacterium]